MKWNTKAINHNFTNKNRSSASFDCACYWSDKALILQYADKRGTLVVIVNANAYSNRISTFTFVLSVTFEHARKRERKKNKPTFICGKYTVLFMDVTYFCLFLLCVHAARIHCLAQSIRDIATKSLELTQNHYSEKVRNIEITFASSPFLLMRRWKCSLM